MIKHCYLHGSLFRPFLVFCAQIPEGSLVDISPSPLERSSFAVIENRLVLLWWYSEVRKQYGTITNIDMHKTISPYFR